MFEICSRLPSRKIKGLIRVDRLRANLLLESDFIRANKNFFSHRILSYLESKNQLLEELYARKETEAIKVALNRTLLANISRQTNRNCVISGEDVAYYYDYIAHPFVSLACHKA